MLKLRDIWITSVVGAITFGTFLALNMLWAPRLLSNLELNTMELGVATAILWLGLAVGAPIADLISNLFKNRRHVISAFAILQGISVIILLYGNLTVHIIYFCMLMFVFLQADICLILLLAVRLLSRSILAHHHPLSMDLCLL
ncbi:UNVERIFIED_CONTAM: hypothetical protein LBW93_05310 [Wolbachia endosymbiont of Nasonia longicornis]